jgi:exopolysaccharide production protein ExoQ
MPPQLALLLCTSFVLYLLRYDRRDPRKVSRVLWIPTLWMFSIATKPLSGWFGGGGEDVEAGSESDRIFLSCLLCLGLFILAKRRLNWAAVIREHIWLVLLIGYMLVSIIWSDMEFVSFKRWVRELTAVIMAFVVLTEPAPREAMKSLLRRTAYTLIPFSLLLIKYFPTYGVQFGRWSGERMWVGVTLQKNALGRLCIISAFFLVWTLIRRWQRRDIPVRKYQTYAELFLLFLTLYLLKGPPNAYPATAIAAFLVGVGAYLGLLWMKKRDLYVSASTVTVIIAAIIALGIITPLVGGSSVAGFTSALGRDATLTGRTDIWAGLLPVAERRPIFGSGFGALWTPDTMAAGTGVNEAHNGYLEVLLQLGLVGLLLTAMFLLSCGRKAQRTLAYDFDWASLSICFLLMLVLHNITESSIDSFTRHLMAVVLFLAVASPAATKRRLSYEQELLQPGSSAPFSHA